MYTPELISSRAAEARLADAGVARRQARRVLRAGLAGAPVVTASAHLYRADAVDELTQRPFVPGAVLDSLRSSGLFVARRDIDVTTDRAGQLAILREGWDLSPWTRVWIRVVCEREGRLPFVATVGGFVALGAEVTAVAETSKRESRLYLRDAGAWFETLRRRRLPTGPGRDWVLVGSPISSVGQLRP